MSVNPGSGEPSAAAQQQVPGPLRRQRSIRQHRCSVDEADPAVGECGGESRCDRAGSDHEYPSSQQSLLSGRRMAGKPTPEHSLRIVTYLRRPADHGQPAPSQSVPRWRAARPGTGATITPAQTPGSAIWSIRVIVTVAAVKRSRSSTTPRLTTTSSGPVGDRRRPREVSRTSSGASTRSSTSVTRGLRPCATYPLPRNSSTECSSSTRRRRCRPCRSAIS